MSPGWVASRCGGIWPGSIDVVLRLPGQRYLVVDYKTNHLGDTAADYSFAALTEAMLHSDYPLQALLYIVVLHRFLRWRAAGYDPARHLGGVLYLFVRGMCGADTPVCRRPPGRGVQLEPAGRAGGGAVGSARRGAAARVTVTDGLSRSPIAAEPAAAARPSTRPVCWTSRMCRWRNGLARWARSPTSEWRWR